MKKLSTSFAALAFSLAALSLTSCGSILNSIIKTTDDISSYTPSTGTDSSSNWTRVTISDGSYIIYTFTGSSKNTIKIRDSSFSSSYTSDIKADVWYGSYSPDSPVIDGYDFGSAAGKSIYPSYEKVYVKVYCEKYDGGSFAIRVTDYYGDNVDLTKVSSATNGWYNNEVESGTSYVVYSFTADEKNKIYVNDKSNSEKTADVSIDISDRSDFDMLTSRLYDMWNGGSNTPYTLTGDDSSQSLSDKKIYLKVYAALNKEANKGTFAIKVTDKNDVHVTLTQEKVAVNPVVNWKEENLTSGTSYIVYKFTGDSENTLYLLDKNNSEFTASVYIDVYIDVYVGATDYANKTASAMFWKIKENGKTLSYSGKTVYIKVSPAYSSDSNAGTFAIRVTDSDGNNIDLTKVSISS